LTEYARSILFLGDEVGQMMKVVGEEGTALEDYILYLKSDFLDAVYLQQNAFDPVDAAIGVERQRHVFDLLFHIVGSKMKLDSKEGARKFFYKLRQKFIDYNSAEWESDEFTALEHEIREMFDSVSEGLQTRAEEAYSKRGNHA
jgi:V/A-type H+-transporting ATPase subunit A